MKRAGAPSWKVSVTHASQLLHAVLFIRDALGLTTGSAGTKVPTLLGEVPDLTARAGDVDLGDVSTQWPAWWRRVVLFECAMALGEFSGESGRAIAGPDSPPRVFDPPEFESLANAHDLRVVARALYHEALHWRRESSFHDLDATRRAARSGAINRVVNELTTAEGIPAELLVAAVVVVDVEGFWSESPRSGVLLASPEYVEDETFFTLGLREVLVANAAKT